MNHYVIGIDGGGTKTTGVVADSTGKVIANATVGPSNPNNVTREDLNRELATLFHILKTQCGEAFFNVKRAFAGMSGVEHPLIKKEMKEIIASLLPDTVKVSVNNDAIIALYSGTLGQPGIVQIAGTGSITYGLNDSGALSRVGGWGYLLGEKGSGYSLGHAGLVAAFNAYDGIDEYTDMVERMMRYFEIQSLPDVVRIVYQSKNKKEIIASLSKLVTEAADAGDGIALKIVKENAVYLGNAIACLIQKHFFKGKNIPVVLVGGLFNRVDLFKNPIEQILQKKGLSTTIIIPSIKPVGGAVIAALLEEEKQIAIDYSVVFSESYAEIKGGGRQ